MFLKRDKYFTKSLPRLKWLDHLYPRIDNNCVLRKYCIDSTDADLFNAEEQIETF